MAGAPDTLPDSQERFADFPLDVAIAVSQAKQLLSNRYVEATVLVVLR